MKKELNDILIYDHTTRSRYEINTSDVMPRYKKVASEQKSRTKSKAEVFTPVSIVKKMNDSFDAKWTGSDTDYIKRTCLEVTCGEAPFLTTRYDAATGQDVPVKDRVGLLDRKLKHIPTDITPVRWAQMACEALKSTYGYEWQPDSIYLARMNLVMTVKEHYEDVFGSSPDDDTIYNWAVITSYNIIRMDGITMCLPETNIPALIMNWEAKRMERFDGKEEEKGLW